MPYSLRPRVPQKFRRRHCHLGSNQALPDDGQQKRKPVPNARQTFCKSLPRTSARPTRIVIASQFHGSPKAGLLFFFLALVHMSIFCASRNHIIHRDSPDRPPLLFGHRQHTQVVDLSKDSKHSLIGNPPGTAPSNVPSQADIIAVGLRQPQPSHGHRARELRVRRPQHNRVS